MQMDRKDRLATTFVGVAVLATVIWAVAGAEEETAVRIVTAIVLALGFAASASAVVPGFAELLHGPKLYLAVTSLVGLGALAAGIAALVTGSALMLGLLVLATLVLWGMSTAHHASAARHADMRPLGGTPATP
jgi:hypothetical protein